MKSAMNRLNWAPMMIFTHRVIVGLTLFGLGIVCGLSLRGAGAKSWALRFLGIERNDPPQTVQPPVASSSFVVLALGQSNAGNHGEPKGRAGAGTYAFTPLGFFSCEDPIPGASGGGGSVWSRWSALRRMQHPNQSVVVACVAQGSSFADDWKPGGRHHPRVAEVVLALHQQGDEIDAVVWHQGETEAWEPAADGRVYAATLREVTTGIRALGVAAPIFVCQTSRNAMGSVNTTIREAQASVCDRRANIYPGPDTDRLGDAFRADGVHFNERGMERFAVMLEAAFEQAGVGRAL